MPRRAGPIITVGTRKDMKTPDTKQNVGSITLIASVVPRKSCLQSSSTESNELTPTRINQNVFGSMISMPSEYPRMDEVKATIMRRGLKRYLARVYPINEHRPVIIQKLL